MQIEPFFPSLNTFNGFSTSVIVTLASWPWAVSLFHALLNKLPKKCELFLAYEFYHRNLLKMRFMFTAFLGI